ncbi:MAG: hypothetical protein HYT03_00255 [Candidatus Harrisonbacteria bacterium]|nr:hypothetical protein [Candidatus Harrisonbacteria bacterium]
MPIRKILAVGLVLGSVLLALLIIFDKSYKIQLESNLSDLKFEDPSSLTSSFGKTEPAVEELSQKIVEEIIRLNPEGPIQASGISQINALEPKKMVDEVLSKELASIDYQDFVPKIKLDSINIVKGLDKKLAENYLKNLGAILENNFYNKDYDFQNAPIDAFNLLASAYQKSIAQVYSLTVPGPLIEIHIRGITLLEIQKSVFESLANYEKNPFKAVVAIRLLKEVGEGFEELAHNINNFDI